MAEYDYPYYPYKWPPGTDCSVNMKVQNKDGKKPSSCEEIVPTGGDDYCSDYVGYYPDNNNDVLSEFHHCTNNTFSSGCRDALVSPQGCRLMMTGGPNYNFSDKSAWEALGWSCEKPPGDSRTNLTSTYFPVNPEVNTIRPAGDDSEDIVIYNMCGNRWGNDWANRCRDTKTGDWPKCNTVKDSQNCEEVIGCKWLWSHGECVQQSCSDMIQTDLICDSKLCNWNPKCANPDICGPVGPPPRGFTGRGSRRKV